MRTVNAITLYIALSCLLLGCTHKTPAQVSYEALEEKYMHCEENQEKLLQMVQEYRKAVTQLQVHCR